MPGPTINGKPLTPFVPVPDPTLLTTEQLIRAIGALREVIETRLDGMDKGIVLLQTTNDKFPAFVAHEIKQLEALHDERFKSVQVQFRGIETQFVERDTRTEQNSQASTTAINAALQAAKEAVGQQNVSFALATSKSEAATTKQMDGLQILIQTGTKATDEKIDDIKSRLMRIEGMGVGQISAKQTADVAATQQTSSNALIVAIVVGSVGGLLGIAGLIVGLIKIF